MGRVAVTASLVFAAALLASAMPASARAAEPTEGARLVSHRGSVDLRHPGKVWEDGYYIALFRTPSPINPQANPVVATLHGGGWRGGGRERTNRMMGRWIRPFAAAGFDVANIDYRARERSLPDARRALRRLVDELGGRPVCVMGSSAGAHLATMLAVFHPSKVACVIDVAGPADLADWGGRSRSGRGRRMAIRAFGVKNLDRYSPIRLVDKIRAPLLIGASRCDNFTSLELKLSYADALARAGNPPEVHLFEPGDDTKGAHCKTTFASRRHFVRLATGFLTRHLVGEYSAPASGAY